MAVLMQRDSGKGPIKSRELEVHLVALMRKGDQRARDRLVESQMGFVVNQAKRQSFGCAFEDLVQQGVLGILRALEDFDPKRGNRLGTYALNWIKAYGLSYAIDNRGPVRIATGADLRSVVYSINRVTWERESKGQETTTDAMAEAMNVSRETIERVRHFLGNFNLPLDAPEPEGPNPSKRPQIASEAPTPEEEAMDNQDEEQVKAEVLEGLAALEPRDRRVIILRFGLGGGEPRTLLAVGKILGVTRERVRQIEARALAKMREVLG